jgi:hypothetical protein
MALTLNPTIVPTWLLPNDGQLQPTRTEIVHLRTLCLVINTDGYSTNYVVDHKLNVSAADLAASWPAVEILDPVTNPLPVSTGTTRTVVTGLALALGITVSNSLANSIQFNFASPLVGPASFLVYLTRNPATLVTV